MNADRDEPGTGSAVPADTPATPTGRAARRNRRRQGLVAVVLGTILSAALLLYDSVVAGALASPPEPTVAPIDASSGEVTAFPVPGTATVMPAVELSFRGTTDLSGLSVVGKVSGEHTGSVVEHGDGDGASWVPDESFTQGEQITVSTDLAIRGSDGGSYTLTVAELGDRPELEEPPVSQARVNADTDEGEVPAELVHQFVSEPGLEPPLVEVSGPEAGTTTPPPSGEDASPGMTAIGVKNGYTQKGPMLVDDAGQPVWFHPLDGVDARDVQVQTLHGEPVLTWWEGLQPIGYGYGESVVVDQSYREVARFDMASGYDADSHETRLTDRGTALMIAYEPVRMDTAHVGGSTRGQAVDNVIQEIDIETGALLFEWHSIGQVGLNESYLEMDDSPYDYFHANSVEVDDDGDLLISARHTCAAYSVDRETGILEWRLGGTDSDFAMGEDATFLKQHDVRRVADGAITLFDNGGTCGEQTREVSRGIALDVDEEAMTAELVREVYHPDELFAQSQANYRELPGVGAQLGWGNQPRWSLMDEDGEVMIDASLPDDLRLSSYRAQRVEWTATPTTDPAAVLADGAVHVSWNGATEVASWRVSADGEELTTADRAGFETSVAVPDGVRANDLVVEALDADGAVLGSADVTG
ncbi:hypothetical protein GCM10023169_03190 [Georgenia halophila]|uniref:Arylsulfotransferase ASST n=1 Tax=Georgenia halophila TaxID=620889 RepID=A0ABP8KUX5_9MICO